MPLTTDDAGDEEIIDIFVEEAGEVFQGIDRDLAVWRQRPTDRDALAGIRRGFHTLKGSGRMVKALDLGELAWKVENMLNRVIDGAVPVTDPMVQLVAASRGVMPKLVEAFKSRRKAGMGDELESLMNQADAIASGQTPTASPRRPAPAPAGDEAAAQMRLTEIQRTLDRSAQRSDEALQRSEMALQQVRRLAAEISAMQSDAQGRAGPAALAPLAERVSALSGEILELRLELKRTQQDSAPHPRELLQSIDQRIREKLAPTERFRSEVERKLEESRRTAASARNLAIWAVLIGVALLGGTAVAVFLGSP
jgi:chemosensory pili system protein ChpA (sensor histidine kinase/response regulator)